jgi:hypothetical protein
MKKKSTRKGRGNFLAMRSSRRSKKYTSIKQGDTRSKRTQLKHKQRIREKIKQEKAQLDELSKTRQEYIKIVKKVTDKYKTANLASVNLLFEKLGSEDLIAKILDEIEIVNSNLDERLNLLLQAMRDIDNEDPGLYELDALIEEADREQKKQLKTVDMDKKSTLIKKILDEIQTISELEEARMEDDYGNDRIVAIIDTIL